MDVEIRGRQAFLVPEQCASKPASRPERPTAQKADGYIEINPVDAKITPVDLHALIQPVKDAHFERHGRHWTHNYDRDMAALKDGKALKRLQEDPLARQLVWTILDADSWVRIESPDHGVVIDGKFIRTRTYGAIEVPFHDKDVRRALYALMNEDGLLDVMFGGCGDSGAWCFESEIIYGQDRIERSGEKPEVRDWGRYEANPELRRALGTALEPFAAERRSYAHLVVG